MNDNPIDKIENYEDLKTTLDRFVETQAKLISFELEVVDHLYNQIGKQLL